MNTKAIKFSIRKVYVRVYMQEFGKNLSKYWSNLMKIKQLGNIMPSKNRNNPDQGRVFDSEGLCPCLTSMQGGGRQPMIVETVRIKQATKDGYIECKVGGVADLSFPDSATRRGRVQEGGDVCPTLTSTETGVCRIEKKEVNTYSDYVNKKYKEFYDDNGYIPQYFNPYNKKELIDISPTLTAQGESITKSSTVLKFDDQYRIRKLTPKECWRLMSFTDDDFHKAEAVNSNTQLYKQAGNSIVVSVLEAIFRQMHIQNIKTWNEIQNKHF